MMHMKRKPSKHSRLPWTSIGLFVIFLFLSGCARLPDNSGRSTSFAIKQSVDTRLGKIAIKTSALGSDYSGYLLLGNGLDALVARAVLARYAEHSIDAQYYLLHSDAVGMFFINELIKAADRGVRVRLLIDDMDMEGRDLGIAVLDAHSHIEVRLFNPFGRNTSRIFQFLTGFGEQTRRAHNKSFTVDSAATILGGRNIGDAYFVADPDKAFLDLDVLAIGPVAAKAAGSFDLYWNHELSYPISFFFDHGPTGEEALSRKEQFDDYIAEQAHSPLTQALLSSDLAQTLKTYEIELIQAPGHVVSDHPDKLTHATNDMTGTLIEDFTPYLEETEKELLIISPYFIPGQTGLRFFEKLRERGVRVVVFTNALSSTDVSMVHAGYARYRRALLKMGVELYELNRNLKGSGEEREKTKIYESKASLHAKSVVIDRKKVFIGSLNLDARSVIQNTEIGVVIDSERIAQEIGDFIDDKIDVLTFRLELQSGYEDSEYIVWHGIVDGRQTTLKADPYTSFWQRFMVGLMGILPIESQL